MQQQQPQQQVEDCLVGAPLLLPQLQEEDLVCLVAPRQLLHPLPLALYLLLLLVLVLVLVEVCLAVQHLVVV